MALSPDSMTSRRSSSEELPDSADFGNAPILEHKVIAASRSKQDPSIATETTAVPSNRSSYVTALSKCQSKEETTASSSRCGALHQSLQSSVLGDLEQNWQQEACIKFQQDSPRESAQRHSSAIQESADLKDNPQEKDASLHTAATQITSLLSSIPAMLATDTESSDAATESNDKTENGAPGKGCQFGKENACPEPATPLVTKSRTLPTASSAAAAAPDVFQTPPSDCAREGRYVQDSSSEGGDSDEERSPLIPQSTVRRGCRQVFTSDDEEPCDERSLPFMTAIASFDSTFPTAGSGYAPTAASQEFAPFCGFIEQKHCYASFAACLLKTEKVALYAYAKMALRSITRV